MRFIDCFESYGFKWFSIYFLKMNKNSEFKILDVFVMYECIIIIIDGNRIELNNWMFYFCGVLYIKGRLKIINFNVKMYLI